MKIPEKKEKLLSALKENPFVLAPMAGITDHAFRSFMKSMGAGVVVSELVSATGLEYKSERTMALTGFDEEQRPVGIQLFGEDGDVIGKGAKFVENIGADFVDLNFGCPVPKVVKKGAGSAMLKDLKAMTQVLRATVAATSLPVTIKIRTGWDESTRNADEVVKIAYNEGITWVAIHGRTRAQGYSGFADWDYIGEVKANAKLPVLGNGDIANAEQAVERLSDSACDGVLIGRGCLKNPYIFREAQALWKEKQELALSKDYRFVLNSLHDCLQVRCSERIVQIQLKKFAAWYSTGYPGAAQFRKDIFQKVETPEIMSLAEDFFSRVTPEQIHMNHNGFLMGGHG